MNTEMNFESEGPVAEPTERPARDLILATSQGYTFDELSPFFESLGRTSFDGLVWVLCDRDFPELRERAYDYEVRIEPFTARRLNRKIYKLSASVVKRMPSRPLLEWFVDRYSYVYQRRYLLYRRLLATTDEVFGHVMTTDIRDVVFQEDPFARFPEGEEELVCCFLESGKKPIEECRYNSQWIRALRGDEYYEARKGEPISCSGITIGDFRGMKAYLDALVGVFHGSIECGAITGIDQGVHNLLLHGGKIDGARLRVVPNEEAWVLTMGYMPESSFRWEGDELRLDSGARPSVLHQFDRFDALKGKVEAHLEPSAR